jgi:hypothetical protein
VSLSPLQWSFPHTTAFPTPGCWAGDITPAFSGQLVYLHFCEGLPPPPFGAQGAPPSLLCVFFTVVIYYSVWFFFSFFPWVEVGLSRGYADLAQGCLWEYHMLLSSPGGLHLPEQSGSWRLAVWEPSWFLRLPWSGDAVSGLGVWRSQGFVSSQWFLL